MEHFEEFFVLLPERRESERSWRVPVAEIERKNYDLKAVNPHRRIEEDSRTPEEIISLIEASQSVIKEAIESLRREFDLK